MLHPTAIPIVAPLLKWSSLPSLALVLLSASLEFVVDDEPLVPLLLAVVESKGYLLENAIALTFLTSKTSRSDVGFASLSIPNKINTVLFTKTAINYNKIR